MQIIETWAPYAASVDLQLASGELIPMHPRDNGWWRAPRPLQHGTDYGFRVNNEGPFPDPRSRWQPHGAHGLSRVFCPQRSWEDDHWRGIEPKRTVIYEMHIGTFSRDGTFLGAIQHLDHLVKLGITHIELLPLAQFAGQRGWGYDGVQLFAPHHAYGDPQELMELVDACHSRGLAVILDVVYNHLGPSGNYLGQFGPYFHHHYHTPWGEAVNVDGCDSPEVRRFFIDNALMWLEEYHFDGLRLDAVQTIVDGSAIHFLEQLSSEVQQLEQRLERPLMLIAESHLNDGRLMTPQSQGGYGLHAQWHDDFHHAVYAYMTGERAGYFQDYGELSNLVKVLNEGVFFDGGYCEYRKRLLGRPADKLSGHNFVAYIQNHDQVGNRPGGERLSHLLSLGQLKIAAAILLTSPFIPMLFQGEEWGSDTPFLYFTDHQEEGLGNAVERGRRQEAKEFGWPLTRFSNPQEPDSFDRSVLNWQERLQPEKEELLKWYRSLLKLRANHPQLQTGDFLRGGASSSNHLLEIRRDNILVLCNFASAHKQTPLPHPYKRMLLRSTDDITIASDRATLPGHSVVIIEG